VLNKRDLLDEAAAAKASAALAQVLPAGVKVIAASAGKVDPKALIGLALGSEQEIENRRTWHDEAATHDHDDFDSFVVPLPEIADPLALAARVGKLSECFDVLRVKGFASVAGKPMRLLLQAVGARVSHQYDRPWSAGEARAGRLVVIGRKGFDRAAVTRAVLG